MTTYQYQCENAECQQVHEERHPMGKHPRSIQCPACGSIAEQAFLTPPVFNREKFERDSKYPYVSHRLPRGMDGCPHDATGKPVVMDRQHEREIMAKHGYERE